MDSVLVINNPKCLVNRLKDIGERIDSFLCHYEKENTDKVNEAETILRTKIIPCIMAQVKDVSKTYNVHHIRGKEIYRAYDFYKDIRFEDIHGYELLPEGFKFHWFHKSEQVISSENDYVLITDIDDRYNNHICIKDVEVKVYFDTSEVLLELRTLKEIYISAIDKLTCVDNSDAAYVLNAVQEIGVPLSGYWVSKLKKLLELSTDSAMLSKIEEIKDNAPINN